MKIYTKTGDNGTTRLVDGTCVEKFSPRVEATLDIFNLTDKKANDIQYFYESQLPGEAAPVADRYVHAAEPRSARVTLQVRF